MTEDLGYERTNQLLEQLDAAKKAYTWPCGKLKDMLGLSGHPSILTVNEFE